MTLSMIKAENLGKCYRINHLQQHGYTALRDVIAEKVCNIANTLTGQEKKPSIEVEEFWALKNISFEISHGEVVGIIGRNGAGKSTLLKILSRITEPTAGRARITGRVASLLEVGTGFHPELTGRENIYLNGAILGMTRKEIRRNFDEIVAFAEVEKFLDTPVKRYSSGMYVRLAFSVAAHLEPDIMVVDEVLAVGDIGFQKRCLGKMKDVASRKGRTILFVSHNMAAIETLCSRAIYLNRGEMVSSGDVKSQINAYLSDFASGEKHSDRFPVKLSPDLYLQHLEFTRNPVTSGDATGFMIELRSETSATVKELSILIYTGLGSRVAILDLRSLEFDNSLGPDNPLKIKGDIQSLDLVEGDYAVGIYINCGEVLGNFLDLYQVNISSRQSENRITPYAPYDRGVVEIKYSFDRMTD